MIEVAVADGVQVVRINRPQARNALLTEAYVQLHRAFDLASADPDVGAVVVTGAGGTFCAGQDLKQIGGQSPEALASVPFHAFIEALARCSKPVIGAVEGNAIGVGFTMLLHMDFVVAAKDARLRVPFVPLGATAEAGSSVLLPAILGPTVAARLLLAGDWLDASAPEARPLITRLTAPGSTEEAAMQLARLLAAQPRHSVQATKALLVASREDALLRAFARERAALTEIARQVDAGAARAPFTTGVVTR